MMSAAQTKTSNEQVIRGLIDARIRAIQAGDAEPLVQMVASDVVLFDALDGLQRQGADELREKTEQWLGWYNPPIGYEVRDLRISAGDDVAFCSLLYHVSGTMKNGSEVDMWVRDTIGFERRGEDWKIVHEHTSVPFEAETGKALVKLTP